jgi:hypothetical protein
MATFDKETLSKFADACASIPLRPLDRAFEGAGIRPGVADDDSGGARRTQFRRYLANVDQRDKRQLQRLGDALGALIDEVADSKKEFLIGAAERDGFAFENGAFRAASTAKSSFAITQLDPASIEDVARRLDALASRSPKDAIAGAKQLVDSVLALHVAGQVPEDIDECLQRLRWIVQKVSEFRIEGRSNKTVAGYAKLAIGAAVTLGAFAATRSRITDRTPTTAGS